MFAGTHQFDEVSTLMFKKIFTWWNSSTMGAAFDIKRRSEFVGTDDYGNRYFQAVSYTHLTLPTTPYV